MTGYKIGMAEEAVIADLTAKLAECKAQKDTALKEYRKKVLLEAAERLSRIMGGDGIWQHEVEDELRKIAEE